MDGIAHACEPGDWTEEYNGYRCRVCQAFVPFGSEPWAADEEGERGLAAESGATGLTMGGGS